MKEFNIVEVINIIKKFKNEKWYEHGKNINVFKLFDIDVNDPRTAIAKCQRLRELFRIDYVETIPLKYRFEYNYILEEIMPMIPYEKNEILDKLRELLDNSKKYSALIKHMDKQAYEEMIDNTRNAYSNKYIQYTKYTKINMDQKELKRSLNIMRMLINRLKKSSNKQDNIYDLLLISKSRKVESIRLSYWFKKLVNVSKDLIFSYYKQELDAPDSDAVYFDKIIDLIIAADEVYLHNEKNKKAYDLFLNSVKVDKNAKTTDLAELEKRYYELSIYNIIDLFALFEINPKLSSSEILNSDQYAKLQSLFNNKITTGNPVHEQLLSSFKEFQGLLKNKEARAGYQELISRSKNINGEKVKEDYAKYSKYEAVIDIIIGRYKRAVENSVFINYYDVFNLDPEADIESIKADLSLISNAIKPEFAVYVSDKENYNKLLNILNTLNNNILANPDNKKMYDEKLEASKNTINYKYSKKKYRIEWRYRKTILPYFRTLENSLIRNGVEKTVELLTEYFNGGYGVEEKMFSRLAFHDAKKIRKTIVSVFGPRNNLEETIKRSVNYYLNRKHDLLCGSIDLTYRRYGVKYTKEAVLYYMLTSDPQAFEPGDKYDLGKQDLEAYIKPAMIRLIVGTHFKDLDLLNKSLNEVDMNSLNDRVNTMIEDFIKKNHPVKSHFKILKK